MGWFGFSKNRHVPIVVAPPVSNRVEVELHKSASVQAAKKAQEASKHLNNLLVENGFTLKIYLAAGGHSSKINEGKK